jgi:predicted NBD/HSP70 family sugar kinase
MKGSNQTTVRDSNERLVLHLIRRHGALTKADAAREIGLSPNAVSMIFNALEEEKLLLRGKPLRGRIGQPSVPLRLNPDARFYVGVKIGRRSFDMMVVDFQGAIRARRQRAHAYPTPGASIDFIRSALPGLLRSAGVTRAQVSGSGIAMPSQLWHWARDFDASQTEMDAWRDFDPAAHLGRYLPQPLLVENDGTAACRAEWALGNRPERRDCIYFFIGTFVGGGVVLDGCVFRGCRGNAGGFGPLRVPDERGGTRLIDHASLVVLEHMLQAAQRPALDGLGDDGDWDGLEPVLSDWIARAARSLAHAVVSSAAVIDFDHVVIDGAFPDRVRARIVEAVDSHLDDLDLQGIVRPAIWQGSLGSGARALGAACAHISARYMIDRSLNALAL